MSWLSPDVRKWLYSVTAGVNTLALAVIPLLVSLGWLDAPVAEQVTQVVAGVLALVSAIVAVNFVPKKAGGQDGE